MRINSQDQLISLNPKSLSEGMLKLECEENDCKEDEAIGRMLGFIKVWKECAKKMKESKAKTPSGLAGGDARKVFHSKDFLGGPLLKKAAFYSLSVSQSNALMGKIVAAPTAGSAGVLPGVLLAIADEFSLDDKKVARSIFAAAGIGMIIYNRASFAGALVGCQGEIGSAAAMAAAAGVDLKGGDAKQACFAASLALKNFLGLACDPICGLVEVPCIRRNALASGLAVTAASLALCGVESAVPFEEVVSTMASIGAKMDSSIKETAVGGLATTPTARKICGKFCLRCDSRR